MAENRLFEKGQMKRLQLIGAVPYFYTAVNLQYKSNTSAKLNDEVADIYEKATGEIVSRNWSCGRCAFEVFRKAGELYYKSEKHYADTKDSEPGRLQGEGQAKGRRKEKGKGTEKTQAEG